MFSAVCTAVCCVDCVGAFFQGEQLATDKAAELFPFVPETLIVHLKHLAQLLGIAVGDLGQVEGVVAGRAKMQSSIEDPLDPIPDGLPCS